MATETDVAFSGRRSKMQASHEYCGAADRSVGRWANGWRAGSRPAQRLGGDLLCSTGTLPSNARSPTTSNERRRRYALKSATAGKQAVMLPPYPPATCLLHPAQDRYGGVASAHTALVEDPDLCRQQLGFPQICCHVCFFGETESARQSRVLLLVPGR